MASLRAAVRGVHVPVEPGTAGSRVWSASQRRTLFWTAVGFEIVGWWLFIALAAVTLPEAYTLPFAALALLVGIVLLIRNFRDR